MLVNVFHDSPGEHRRLLLAGVALIVSMALLVYLSIAIYNKIYAEYFATNRDGIDIREFYARYIKTRLDRELRKSGVVLYAIQPLFGQGDDRYAVDHDGRGRTRRTWSTPSSARSMRR